MIENLLNSILKTTVLVVIVTPIYIICRKIKEYSDKKNTVTEEQYKDYEDQFFKVLKMKNQKFEKNTKD